jgi:RND family efflux transporter MFP subunit
MRAIVPVIGIVAVLVLAGCKDKVKPGTVEVKRQIVTGITLAKVGSETVDTFYQTAGTVKAKTISAVASRTMGTVTSITVREGDRVSAGQTLIVLDDRDMSHRVAAGEASYNEAAQGLEAAEQQKFLAEVTYRRYGRLYDEKAVSRHEMDQIETQTKVARIEYERAKASVNRAKAMLEEARIHHGFTRVNAPFAGIVTEKRIEVGSMASPGVPLLILEDTSLFKVEAAVDERFSGKVKTGMPVQIVFDGAGKTLRGSIMEVVPSIDPVSRTFLIKVAVNAPFLRTGLYGKVLIPDGKRDVILVPKKAVVEKGQLTGAYIADDKGVLAYRLIKTGKPYDGRVEVLSGLKTGDAVVVDGMEKAVDGGMIKQ